MDSFKRDYKITVVKTQEKSSGEQSCLVYSAQNVSLRSLVAAERIASAQQIQQNLMHKVQLLENSVKLLVSDLL